MRYLRQNTAVIITVGPFLDKTDGVTPEGALTATNCHIVMTKDDDDGTAVNSIIDTTLTASGGDNDLVHIAHGLYSLELTAAQTNYLGRVLLGIFDEANHCPVFHEFTVLPAQVYDSLILGTDLLQIDVEAIDNDAPAAANLNAACDNYSATRGLAGTALPAAAADAAGGLPISDAGGLDVDAQKTDVAAILADTGTDGVVLPQAQADKVWSSAARTLTSFGTLVADIWASATRTLTATGTPSGPGASRDTITVNDALGNPVADCEVWITSGLDGTTIVAGPFVTNDDGTKEFLLDAGVTYYLFRRKAGMNFSNPASFVAAGD